nr:MAG TPA: hypothetical protein [Caudoviricetes sp.]
MMAIGTLDTTLVLYQTIFTPRLVCLTLYCQEAAVFPVPTGVLARRAATPRVPAVASTSRSFLFLTCVNHFDMSNSASNFISIMTALLSRSAPERSLDKLVLETLDRAIAAVAINIELMPAVSQMLLERRHRIRSGDTISLDIKTTLKLCDGVGTVMWVFDPIPTGTSTLEVLFVVLVLVFDPAISWKTHRRLDGVIGCLAPPLISQTIGTIRSFLSICVRPLRSKNTVDSERALAAVDTVAGGLRSGVRGRGVTLNGLKPAVAEVSLDNTDVVGQTVVIPIEEHNITALRIFDVNLVHSRLRDVRVVAVATDCIDLASHVETHTDEGHAPPDVFRRASKPRLVHTLSKPSTGFRTRLRIVRSVVAESVGGVRHNVVDLAHTLLPFVNRSVSVLMRVGPCGDLCISRNVNHPLLPVLALRAWFMAAR